MHTDLTKVRQCLFNLLSNAVKFTEKGTIELSARREATRDGDLVTFAVADTGIGIASEHMGCKRRVALGAAALCGAARFWATVAVFFARSRRCGAKGHDPIGNPCSKRPPARA